jgi:hypothetical protein
MVETMVLHWWSDGGERDDVRTYMSKAERAAALIYAHFKKEFELPDKN